MQTSEMDTKIEIKEEDPFSDIPSQNPIEIFTKNVTVETHSNVTLLDNDSLMAIKTEITSETPFLDFNSQNGGECFFQYPLKQIKTEIVAHNNSCEIDTKIEIASHKEEVFAKEPVMEVKYNYDHKTDTKLEIKDELPWSETEISYVFVGIKDGDSTLVTSPRVCIEAASVDRNCDSILTSAVFSEKNTSLHYGKDCSECEIQDCDVPKIRLKEKCVCSEQPHTLGDGRDINSWPLVSCKGERPHKCQICEKSFTKSSHLKSHILIHEGKKPYKCENCRKSFCKLSHLKRHILIHEGKKPYKCEICGRSFTVLSALKRHYLMHEGKKPYKCQICEKSFNQVSNLKSHILIHEGKKPYKCEICERSFTHSSHLKSHILIHESIKPYKCEICKKSFTQKSTLKRHILIHENHRCEICEKDFKYLSTLKSHNLMTHQGKKHQV